jgi:proline-specific peptidase
MRYRAQVPTDALTGKHGRVRFRSWTLWYGLVGAPAQRAPLLFVPGGPGVPHDYFERMAPLAPPHRPLLFYDPSGSGASDRPRGVTWDVDLFVDELEALRVELGLDRFHLFGSSFGGTICLAYALRRPPGLASMTLAATSPSIPASRLLTQRHIASLPPELRDPLSGPRNTPAFVRAYSAYSSRFLCRVPFPRVLHDAMRRTNYEAMIGMMGHGMLFFDGTAGDLDLTPRLGEILVPTLVTCGRHDIRYPTIYEELTRAIRGSRLMLFEDSSHMPQYEEEAAFSRALYAFVDEIDGG